MALSRPVYIVAAKRTAFGAFGGKVKDLSAIVLAEKASSAALKEANLDPSHVKSVIFGNVIQVSCDFISCESISLRTQIEFIHYIRITTVLRKKPNNVLVFTPSDAYHTSGK